VTELITPEEIHVEISGVQPADAVVAEALAIIDAGLGTMSDRKLVSSSEVTDLLLDVRALLAN
jgi:hypothetical protein